MDDFMTKKYPEPMKLRQYQCSGLCLNYGPSKYHDTVLHGSFNNMDGKRVPVYITNDYLATHLDYCQRICADGYAVLKATEEGVVADCSICIPGIEREISKLSGMKLGCYANAVSHIWGMIRSGEIRYVTLSLDGVGDEVVLKEKEEK